MLSLIGLAPFAVDGAQSIGASSGTSHVTASVVITWIADRDPAGVPLLDLAVLWRGAPGWFTAGDPNAQSGGGTSSGLPDGRRGPESHFIAVSGLRLEMKFDPSTSRAQIQDEIISVKDANVILVDEVDSATGPRIVGRVLIDTRFPDSQVDIEAIVRRAPELFSYLRCEEPFPDQPQRPPIEMTMRQQMMDLMCARLRAQ
jgi:hypothetical protein